jgi:hypothetical protein
MEELFARIWENLTDRVSGPMWLRLVLQPSVAIFFAIRDGLKDAREQKPAFFSTLITSRDQRMDLIRDGWSSIVKVFFMAMVVDAIYQLIVERWIYPGEIFIVAFLLAVVPYTLVRGPVSRIFRRSGSRQSIKGES